MKKLEDRYRQEQAAREEQERQFYHALRQLMLEDLRKEERQGLPEKVRERFFTGAYVGFCSGRMERSLPENVLCIRGKSPAVLYAVPAESAEEAAARLSCPLGRSAVCQGAEGLYDCYQEAHSAWERSFFTGALCEGPARPGWESPAGAANWRQLRLQTRAAAGQAQARTLGAESLILPSCAG